MEFKDRIFVFWIFVFVLGGLIAISAYFVIETRYDYLLLGASYGLLILALFLLVILGLSQ